MEQNSTAVEGPLKRQVRPALGYKHHAERVRNTGLHMEPTAEFIEAQNAEIEYLYAALQRVHKAINSGPGRCSRQCQEVRGIASAALKYEA
jgi:hypothetical protein